MLHIILEALPNAVMITGLVVIMMMMIECFNVWSRGRLAGSFKGRGFWQIFLSAFLGAVPGCMGGFAVVSMYTHGLVSFGALVAMMIATSGDESFVMLAMIPQQALWIMLALFVLSVVAGLLTDLFHKPVKTPLTCGENFAIHEDDSLSEGRRTFGWKRLLMTLSLVAFILLLVFGLLEHEHSHGVAEPQANAGGINLLSEEWMNYMFAGLSLVVLGVLLTAKDHFVDEHLWHHIICRHLPSIFLWTFGTLIVLGIGLHHFEISLWINDNTALMILLAAAVGLIPESGPHLIFVTLFAAGIVPLPVLLASCISQDGHAALPLLAETKRGFITAKAINFLIALAVGYATMLL